MASLTKPASDSQQDREPDVTVVIPVWDEYVEFLGEAVESVRQNADDAPIVVVDNRSVVPVPELPGTTVVQSDRRLTVGAARNVGLEHVRTPNVLNLDADDKLLPGTLEYLSSRLELRPSVAVSVTSILDADTGDRHRFPRSFVRLLARLRRTFAVMDCVWSLYPTQGCAMMRTAQVRDAGGYADANWGEDWALAVSLAFRGRVEVKDRPGRYYRATPESLWRRPRRARDFVASARRIRERLRNDDVVPGWARALMPAIALMQLTAVYVVRPTYLVVRTLLFRNKRK